MKEKNRKENVRANIMDTGAQETKTQEHVKRKEKNAKGAALSRTKGKGKGNGKIKCEHLTRWPLNATNFAVLAAAERAARD